MIDPFPNCFSMLVMMVFMVLILSMAWSSMTVWSPSGLVFV
jgi:hypothetical protein